MASRRTYHSRRVFASYLLVFLQMQLLGAAMLHRHGETSALEHGLSVSTCEAQPSGTADGNLLCTVCLIVHNGAVQPANAAQVLPPSISIALLRRLAPSSYRSELPAMNYGRAPPLA